MKPVYATIGSAAADLSSIEDDFVLHPGSRKMVSTGAKVDMFLGSEFSNDHAILIVPRSGLAHKHGVTVLNAPGLVDPDYEGEVKVNLINLGDSPVHISKWDRVAQALIVPIAKSPSIQTADIVRGSGGHGSTGR